MTAKMSERECVDEKPSKVFEVAALRLTFSTSVCDVFFLIIFNRQSAVTQEKPKWDQPVVEQLENLQRRVDSALQRLKSGTPEEQFAAQADCADSKDPQCTAALVAFLKDKRLRFKQNALAALAGIRDFRSLKPILAELDKKNHGYGAALAKQKSMWRRKTI